MALPPAGDQLLVEMDSAASGAGTIGVFYNVDDLVVATIRELAKRGLPSPAESRATRAYRGAGVAMDAGGAQAVGLARWARRTTEPPQIKLEMADFRTRL